MGEEVEETGGSRPRGNESQIMLYEKGIYV